MAQTVVAYRILRAGLALGLGVAMVTGCGKKSEAPPEPRLVDVVRVSFGNVGSDVAYSGEVRARYETSLGFRVPGKLVARQVEVGSSVNARQVLARLDPEDQKLNTRSAQSQLAAAKSEYDQAKADLSRYRDLHEKAFISKAEFDRHQSAYDVAKARFEQAQAQLAVTKNQAGYTELIADHAGVVTAIQAEVGQVVAAGQTVIRLARTGEREVVISVPENRLAELNSAREIAISLWAEPSKFLRGKVREVSPSADPVTRTYAAKVSVLDSYPGMKLGMTANVYLRGIHRGSVALLPATSLFQDKDKAAVWVVDKASSQVRLVPVEVGQYLEDKVAIASGLEPGDVVVRAGVHKLFAGEKVRVREDRTDEAAK